MDEECGKVHESCSLVSINDIQERDFVKLLGDRNSYVAVGSQDEGHEDIWKNRDGSTFNPRLWEESQPSECCGGQDCMGLVLNEEQQTYMLHDIACDGAFSGYICECKSSKKRLKLKESLVTCRVLIGLCFSQ